MRKTNSNPVPTWSTWREIPAVVAHPTHARRTAVVAATVGTMFFLMNQLGALLAGQTDSMWWIKTALTFLTPMIVSNIGVLSATRTQAHEPPPRSNGRRRVRRAWG